LCIEDLIETIIIEIRLVKELQIAETLKVIRIGLAYIWYNQQENI